MAGHGIATSRPFPECAIVWQAQVPNSNPGIQAKPCVTFSSRPSQYLSGATLRVDVDLRFSAARHASVAVPAVHDRCVKVDSPKGNSLLQYAIDALNQRERADVEAEVSSVSARSRLGARLHDCSRPCSHNLALVQSCSAAAQP